MGLELTGERTLPGIPEENYWFRRHEAAYRFAATRCRGMTVVDAGSGEGYGAAILAETARAVVGVELVHDVCRHAADAYPRVPFVQAELSALPLADRSTDAVVALQVIEHLWNVPGALDEVVRVLRPGGLFVCATPNRVTFSGSGAPENPFHVVEYTAGELAALLRDRFREVELLGVHHGPRLGTVEAQRGLSVPGRLVAAPPAAWPEWLAALVRTVTAADFEVRADRPVEASLDLLALARSAAA